MPFWGELKRRNVFKVGAVYVIVAWVILQAVSIIFPLLHLPSWTGTFVTVLIIIGFPVALIFAWAFELTADGVKRTSEVPQQESITHVTGRKINHVLIGVIVLAVAYILFDNIYLDRRVEQPEVVSTAAEQTPSATDITETPKTIAILPFADMSPEKDQEYFVDGLSEELLNCLAKINGLRVTSRTSSFSFKNTDKTLQEVASVLGVEHILEGSVRKAGDALRITAQLIRVKDDSHLWSETYNRELKDIFTVQEDIARTVADELKVKLGVGKSMRQLGGTDNPKAYELYLVAKGQISSAASYEDWKRILNSIEQVFPIDPEFAMAWDLKSKAHIQLSLTGPNSQVADERDAALQAAQKAIKLEPNLGSAYIKLGFIEWAKGHWIDAESYFREALDLSNESLSGDDDYLVAFYNSAGNFKRAQDLIELIRRYDPLHTGYRGHAMYNLAYLGDKQGAEEEYERCRATFGDNAWHNRVITLVRFGSGNVVSREDIVFSDPFIDAAKKHLRSPEEALSELRRYNINSDVNIMSSLFICAAYFNDPEFAMDEIEETLSVHPEGSFHIWFPVLHDVRQLPRFKEFVREIGLVDYWEKFGWPDICHKLDNGDFVCD